MRFSILSRQFPLPEGSAPGRILFALCEGLIAEGHEVAVCSWGPDPPAIELPSWCEWARVDPATGVDGKLHALVRPRADVLRARWDAAPNSIAVADDHLSWPGVEARPRSVLTLHYLTKLDASALRRRALKDLQDRRAQSRAARRARVVLAYSQRLVEVLPCPATFVPIAYPVPPEPLPFVESPVAALLADWRWPPNWMALRWLLEDWPTVRSRIPTAELLLAGRGLEGIGPSDGVRVLGVVPRSSDVLARAAVLAFPVPPTSGPKVKVLESLAYGLPVVTTRAGVEGLVLPEGTGAVVVNRGRFAEELASLLSDPERRRTMGREGRAAVLAAHAPRPAARVRAKVIEAAFSGPRSDVQS